MVGVGNGRTLTGRGFGGGAGSGRGVFEEGGGIRGSGRTMEQVDNRTFAGVGDVSTEEGSPLEHLDEDG